MVKMKTPPTLKTFVWTQPKMWLTFWRKSCLFCWVMVHVCCRVVGGSLQRGPQPVWLLMNLDLSLPWLGLKGVFLQLGPQQLSCHYLTYSSLIMSLRLRRQRIHPSLGYGSGRPIKRSIKTFHCSPFRDRDAAVARKTVDKHRGSDRNVMCSAEFNMFSTLKCYYG